MLKIILGIMCLLLVGCSEENSTSPMMVSVSSNGEYAVTSNTSSNGQIILWDIKDKKARVISNDANIYSAYFIKNTPYFMWQDLNNIVHVQNINGHQILSFQNFPVYGQLMTSDLKNYFASDVNWTIFKGYGSKQKQIKEFCGGEKDMFHIGKLLNLSLSENNQYLLSSGLGDKSEKPISAGMCSIMPKGFDHASASYFDGISLWNVDAGQPVQKYTGLEMQAIAAISPDGKYIVGGDENGRVYVWHVRTGQKIMHVDDPLNGHLVEKPNCVDDEGLVLTKGDDPKDFAGTVNKCKYWDKSGIANPPSGFDREFPDNTFSIKFIDLDGDYLRFLKNKPFAILYNVRSSKIIKIFSLSSSGNLVNSSGYVRDEAIDSAPAANIVVVGKRYTTGIVVYKYDPKTQTLKKIWSPNLYSWPKEILMYIKAGRRK